MDKMRKSLKEAKEDFKVFRKPNRDPGPTVRELRHIHNEMQEILELSAYGNNKFPKSQGDKADLKLFLTKRKVSKVKEIQIQESCDEW